MKAKILKATNEFVNTLLQIVNGAEAKPRGMSKFSPEERSAIARKAAATRKRRAAGQKAAATRLAKAR